MNDMLPDDENSKSSVCVEKAFEIWEETKDKRSAQLILLCTFVMEVLWERLRTREGLSIA